MSDDELSPEAAGLRERMVAGELPRVRLELADELGHRPSRYALGRKDPEPPGPWDPPAAEPTLEAWGRRAGRFGGAIMLRVGAAIARHLGAVVEAPPAFADGLAAADGFLGGGGGGPDLEQAAKGVARAALAQDLGSAPRQACLALLPLLRAMLDIRREGAPDQEELKAHYLRLLEQATPLATNLDALTAAVRDEVVAWALG